MQQPPPQGPYYQPGQQPRYYPQQQGQQPPYYPPQPGGMQQPPRNPRNRNTLIGCGTLLLLLIIIGSCNAIITGGRGLGNTDDTTAQSASPAAVATMQPRATVAHKQQPITAPTHAVPTVAPTAVPTSPPAPTQPPVPTQPPAPTAPPVHTGFNGNPWGYDFNAAGGSLIYQPNPSFCNSGYFQCVTTFWTATNGYVSQCSNGLFTHSGGVRGECSRDGGKGQILYSH